MVVCQHLHMNSEKNGVKETVGECSVVGLEPENCALAKGHAPVATVGWSKSAANRRGRSLLDVDQGMAQITLVTAWSGRGAVQWCEAGTTNAAWRCLSACTKFQELKGCSTC